MSRLLNTLFYSLTVLAVAAALIVAWINRFTVEIPTSDESMRPAISPHETTFDVDTRWLDEPRRNTIVAYIPPGQSGVKYRATEVVAIAGDRVEIRARKAYVNGAVPENVRRGLQMESFPEIVVPRDCVYVLNHSSGEPDSVQFGPLPLWRVGGRLVVKK